MALFDILKDYINSVTGNEAKWNVIESGIEIAVSQNMSMSATASELRELGLKFDDHVFRDKFREQSGYRAKFSYQTHISSDYKPNPALMAESKYPLTANYGYMAQSWIVDNDTGLLKERTFRFDSDELLSQNEALDEIAEHINMRYESLVNELIGGIQFIGSLVSI